MPAPEPTPAEQAANAPHSSQTAAIPFETSLAELNDIVNRLESGSLGLSDSIGAYERGVAILRCLHDQLADVEERVRMLVRIDDQGRPILEAIEPTAATPDRTGRRTGGASATDGAPSGQRTARSASRQGRPKRLPGMDDAGEDG